MRSWSATCAGSPTADGSLPAVTRSRELNASPEAVYDLVSDPRRQAGWWPRVTRIEDVAGRPGTERTRWTAVLQAESGRLLRLDYRCTDARRPDRYEWEQELEGGPFEKHLARQAVRVSITAGTDMASRISLTSIHTLRGTAKLAGFAMRKGQRNLLDAALDGLAELLEELSPGKTG